jgi:Skp family chaperone for outer membrane proteins
LALNTAGEPFPLRRAANGEMEMNARATKLQAAENDLKQLMADVTQAMEKAQDRREDSLQGRGGHNRDRLPGT